MKNDKEKLYKELVKTVRSTNAKLARLYAQIDKDHPGWAASRLLDKLDTDVISGVTSKGFIKYNKNLSIGQMRAILKATEQFQKSKTSTVKGTKENIEKIKSGVKTKLNVSSNVASNIYEFFATDKFNMPNEVKYEAVKVAIELKSKNKSADDYYEMIKNYIDLGNDEDIKEMFKSIYTLAGEKYVDFSKINFSNIEM